MRLYETATLPDFSVPMADSLPDTLGELVDIALKDEDQAFKNKDYRVDMDMWHQPGVDNKTDTQVCYVCLAGVVMAYELGIKPIEVARPLCFIDRAVYRKLLALDEIRKGNIDYAYKNFYDVSWETADKALETYQIPPFIEVTPYEGSRTEWRRNLSLIARILQKRGI